MTDEEKEKLIYSTHSKIYAIKSPHSDEIYIGSTACFTLKERMEGHLANFKRWKEGKTKVFTSSFKILEKGGAYIELIESYPCDGLKNC